MQEAQASRTALRVAVRRAAHQVLDHPKVFDDPLALAIIGPETEERFIHGAPAAEQTASRTLRAFVAVRSRLAEDQLAQAVAAGVRQYVVLGAGLDTFAYRNPHAALRVFEVDHPATQAWKREQLQAAAIAVPESLVFVPVDFERQTLAESLHASGLRPDAAAFFCWLGVVPYLTPRAFEETLATIAAMPAGSGVVFDYAVDRSELNLRERLALDALSARVASAGEPFQLFFTAARMAEHLRQAGFARWDDLDRATLNARYFAGRSDGLAVGGRLARLVCAWV